MQIMCATACPELAVAEGRLAAEVYVFRETRYTEVFVVRPAWEESTFWKINENEKSIKRIDQARAWKEVCGCRMRARLPLGHWPSSICPHLCADICEREGGSFNCERVCLHIHIITLHTSIHCNTESF